MNAKTLQSYNISGIVLAGGRARRMGGCDKGWLEYRGQPLIQHALTQLRGQVDDIVIVANRSLDPYRSFGHPVVSDVIPGFLGPLAGFHAGLGACQGNHALCIPCDAPQFPSDLATRMLTAVRETRSEVAIAHDGRRLQPLFCLLERSLASALHETLGAKRLRTDRWLESRRHVIVDFSDQPTAFININTPEALVTPAIPHENHGSSKSNAL